MGITRKQALKRIAGKSVQIEKHLAKIESDPGNEAAAHWRAEIETWIFQILASAKAIGEKTGDDVRRRVGAWQERLEQIHGPARE